MNRKTKKLKTEKQKIFFQFFEICQKNFFFNFSKFVKIFFFKLLIFQRRSRSSKQCHDESGPMFCELVRTFGDDAYKASAPGATTPEEVFFNFQNVFFKNEFRKGDLLRIYQYW